MLAGSAKKAPHLVLNENLIKDLETQSLKENLMLKLRVAPGDGAPVECRERRVHELCYGMKTAWGVSRDSSKRRCSAFLVME